MQFEDILKQVGDEHRFQTWLIILFLLPTSFFSAFYDSVIFYATPDHWCRVDGLDKLSPELQRQLIRPVQKDTGKAATCYRYDIDYSFIGSKSDLERYVQAHNYSSLESLPTVKCSEAYVYDQSLYGETPITYYNFVCDRDYYVHNILSFALIGFAVITPILSSLSDRIGRRKIFLVTLILSVACVINPLLVKNLPSFVAVRFLSFGIADVFYQLPFVMTQELVSQNFRTRASALSSIFNSLGLCCMPLLAKLVGDWYLISVVHLAIFLPFLLAYKWTPESPLCLISNKKYDEAYEELVKIAKINKRPVPATLMHDIKSIDEKSPSESDHTDNFTELLFRPGLRYKTFIIVIIFGACSLGYGGIAYNTINLEANSQLYQFVFLSMVDIPSMFVFWYLLNTRLGRRWTDVLGLAFCGIPLLVPALLPKRNNQTVITVCTLIAKFSIAGPYMVVYQHASELFPTTLRNLGISVCASISTVVDIGVPQLIYLAKYGQWIPLAIIGTFCLFAAFLASFLPETLNEYLPQRAKDSAEFGRDKPYFCLATVDKPADDTSAKPNSTPAINIDLENIN